MFGWLSFFKPKKKTMFAIDVSKHNGVIDWAKVVTNDPKPDFAILKATEGLNSVDSKLGVNIIGCISNNLRWGCYHFTTWGGGALDAKKQAQHFIEVVKNAGEPNMPMVLDVETNKPLTIKHDLILSFIKTFLSDVVAAGYEVAIYASPGFIESYLQGHDLDGVKLWIAHYTNKPNPRTPGWKTYWMWQYTDQGNVKGINGNVDLNRLA